MARPRPRREANGSNSDWDKMLPLSNHRSDMIASDSQPRLTVPIPDQSRIKNNASSL